MKPDAKRVLEVAAMHLIGRTAPGLAPGYEQSTVSVLGAMLIEAAQEFERAAQRRVEENQAICRLFADARGAVADAKLAARLSAAADSQEESMAISVLERRNAELRALLIELHAHVEQLESAEARRVETAIWQELVASTGRRRVMMGPF